jgi:hypothetical protein
MATLQPLRPEILSVTSHPLGGLSVRARFACGHEQTVVFPQAPRRTSRRELHEWTFDGRADALCSRCDREVSA